MSEDTARPLDKPARNFTKLQTHANIAACWLAIGVSMVLGRDMAALVVPIMATLVAALLGVYQTIGHFDLRAMAALQGQRGERPHSRKRRVEAGDEAAAEAEPK